SVLAVACDNADDLAPTTTAPGAPSAAPTVTPSLAAGVGTESATPEDPPQGVLVAEDAEVALGLGSYCWSPPSASGQQALCADALGVITGIEDLPTNAGATLTVKGELALPPMTIGEASLWIAPDEPAAEGDEFRAWEAVSEASAVAVGN